MQSVKEMPKLRLVLLILFVLMLLCLVGVLLYNIFFDGGFSATSAATATPAPMPIVEEEPTATQEPTARPTKVIEPTPKPTNTPIPPTAEPTDEPEPTPTETVAVSQVTLPAIVPGPIADLMKEGDFEGGFEEGVGLGWQGFKTDNVVAVFSPEGPGGPYVHSGDYAQRITLASATEQNRYAGVYQQIDIVPGEVYSLTINGQIRTGFADMNLSSQGYRMQYAVDSTGGDDWQAVAADAWKELPWDEQLMHSEDVEFLTHSTTITSNSETITVFVRAWNKWADPGEVHYTLDNLSLVGATPVEGANAAQELLIDQPLPTTGSGDSSGFVGSAPFWGAIVVLVLLAVGAVYRSKWSY